MQKACYSSAGIYHPRPGSSTYASKRYILGSPMASSCLIQYDGTLQDGEGPASM